MFFLILKRKTGQTIVLLFQNNKKHNTLLTNISAGYNYFNIIKKMYGPF